MSEASSGPTERRTQERYAAKVELHFRAASEMVQALRAFSVNLSTGGLCLRTKRSYENGTRLWLRILIGGEEVELAAEVAWSRGGAIGVRFVDLTDPIRRKLEHLVETMKAKR